ncbi:PHP domain-containing protein [Microbacterium forte]|uniref:PHP domain-containing protein n=1 Tax=Microbacterium forte TaxID=2982533 RepID=UPI0028931906|nr:PHP domain-containing protein [Microbacterium sp. A(2022)]
MIDLHTHSNHSDGTDDPAALVRLAALAGVTTISLTDHDTTSGLTEARTEATRHRIAFVSGIELSADADGTIVHVLGHYINEHSRSLQDRLRSLREHRRGRAEEIVSRLSADYSITWREVQNEAAGVDSVGRPHIADTLVAKGYARSRPEVFATILGNGSPYVPSLPAPTVEEAIALIDEAGGLSTIAHVWGSARGSSSIDGYMLSQWKSVGLSGLEVWHREHSRVQRAQLLRLADHVGLYTTGGSDYHGTGKPNQLGEYETPPHVLDKMAARVVQRVSAGRVS